MGHDEKYPAEEGARRGVPPATKGVPPVASPRAVSGEGTRADAGNGTRGGDVTKPNPFSWAIAELQDDIEPPAPAEVVAKPPPQAIEEEGRHPDDRGGIDSALRIQRHPALKPRRSTLVPPPLPPPHPHAGTDPPSPF